MCFIRQAVQAGSSRRSFLWTAGSLAAAPLLGGLGGGALAATSRGNPVGQRTRLVLLGTAGGPSWWPGSERASAASALVVRDGDHDVLYLVDLGFGATHRLAQAFNTGVFANSGGEARGGKVQEAYSTWLASARALFFTHLHMDHTTDYPTLLVCGKGAGLVAYPEAQRAKRLQVYGPGTRGQLEDVFPPGRPGVPEVMNPGNPTPGTVDMTGYLWQAFAQTINDFTRDNAWPDFRWLVDLHDIDLPPLPRGDYPIDPETGLSRNTAPWPAMEPIPVYHDDLVTVTATLVNHGPVYPSLAFRFDTADGSVVFSGDTGYPCENLVRLARGADVLVHEVIDQSFIDHLFGDPPAPESAPLKHHLETAHTRIEEVGLQAEAAGARTLVLSHIVPGNTPAAHLQAARAGFSGKLIVGEDLMQIGVG